MEMCSKPCRYLFIDLICYSCSDLLIAAFGVCKGFVIVVVLRLFVWTNYGWSSREQTGLFRCLLIIYWFLSSLVAVAGACTCVCSCACVYVRRRVYPNLMGVGGCVYVLEMSRSHLHWSSHPMGEETSVLFMYLLPPFPSSVFLTLCFLTYAHSTVSLSFSVSFVYYSPCILLCLLSLHYNHLCQSVDLFPSTHPLTLNFYLWLFSIILSIFIALSFIQDPF